MDQSAVKLLTAPLDSSFAIIVMLVGTYSLTVNVRHAAKNNRPRSARFARIAGWCYIAGGAGLLLMRQF